MAYNFSMNSGKLIVTLDTESGKFSENINEYLQPNLVLGNDRVFLKEDGLFKQDFVFEAFGDIGGNTAENLVDAYNLLNALIIGISVNSIENAIPLSGTTAGNPVTGDIEFLEDGFKKIYAKGNLGDNISEVIFEETQLKLLHKTVDGIIKSEILLKGSHVAIENNDPTSRGMTSESNYSENITDLDFTQKIYVDGLRGKHISKTTTEINAISTPQDGETYFNTTLSTLCFWDGTAWKRVTHSAM